MVFELVDGILAGIKFSPKGEVAGPECKYSRIELTDLQGEPFGDLLVLMLKLCDIALEFRQAGSRLLLVRLPSQLLVVSHHLRVLAV